MTPEQLKALRETAELKENLALSERSSAELCLDLNSKDKEIEKLKALLEAVQLEADNGIELAESRDTQTRSEAQQALERIAEMIEEGLGNDKTNL